jgi:DNA excision repair protein ERCC-4
MYDLLLFHKKIISDFITENGLLLMSRGLGIEKILASILTPYCDPHQLVFVLNPRGTNDSYIDEMLVARGVSQDLLPKRLTTTFSQSDRSDIYLRGGVLFVTSRILIVDMLQDRVPMDLISGIIVMNAERFEMLHKMTNCYRLTETCSEAFILRLFRLKNQKGFVKGFSEEPNDFIRGFSHVESTLKLLFVDKLLLWPRFHVDVANDLDTKMPDALDVYAEMSDEQKRIEKAIESLISATIEEIKRGNQSVSGKYILLTQ